MYPSGFASFGSTTSTVCERDPLTGFPAGDASSSLARAARREFATTFKSGFLFNETPDHRIGACHAARYNTPHMSGPQAGARRRQMLEQFIEKNPSDAFARYGLAVECVNEGDLAAAEANFRQLLANHPEYVATYYQFGRMLSAANRIAEAREIFSAGIARARQANDGHSRQELQAALDELG